MCYWNLQGRSEKKYGNLKIKHEPSSRFLKWQTNKTANSIQATTKIYFNIA